MNKTNELYTLGKSIIPGGTQLLSKRAELFAPGKWPAYYKKAKGTRVWDLDDNEYIDMSIMGIGANILGYADDDVDNAVIECIKNGNSSSLNCAEEIELAELLIKLHPWADMVRYARSGGEAMAMAVRIARAATKRDKVLFSGYHGWADWYIAANLGEDDNLDGQLMPGLEPNGIPRGLKGTAIPFYFNEIKELKEKVSSYKNEIAAIVVEPARGEEVPKEYLAMLKDISREIGAIIIFDEITSGFRMNAGGIHLRYGVNPDIAVFAKSIANGYAMSAVIGTEKVMQAVQSTFISSTNWTERIGPVAALATINKYIKVKAEENLIKSGNAVRKIWCDKAEKYSLDVHISGIPTLCHLAFEKENNRASTFFTIEMLKRGILGYRQFKPSYAHSGNDLRIYTDAVDEVFALISKEEYMKLAESELAKSGFYRLTKE